jgi:ribosome maturation factor RimP
MLDDRDVAVQIASPGIDRVLKENSEFCIFIGSKVRVLLHGADNWVAGLISSSDDTSVALETDSGMQTIMFAEIQKAKLE